MCILIKITGIENKKQEKNPENTTLLLKVRFNLEKFRKTFFGF